jgi:hypothetical protein
MTSPLIVRDGSARSVLLGPDPWTPGDLVSAPRGVPHTFTNVTQETAHVINIMTSGGLDRCLTDFSVLYAQPPDASRFEQAAKQHGIEVVGPPLAATLGLAEQGSW